MIRVGDTALITTDNWFVAPDGRQYRAVFGTVKAVRSDAETLGIKTNRHSSNWYIEIGCMVLAGCQIHYAIKTVNVSLLPVEKIDKDGSKQTMIFDADSC